MNEMEREGKIDRAKGKIRSTWGDLTDDDFDKAQGNVESLIGRIKEKTGETVEDIQRKLDGIFSGREEEETAATRSDRT
jgi:uncharacterized protein YjbJ (UPF0337 family)